MLTEKDLYNLLLDSGALMEGHFVLTSGLHSDKYVEKFRVLENPQTLDKICEQMYLKFKDTHVDIVIGAAIGGILLASTVAKYFDVKGIFSERQDGVMTLKRGFHIPEGSNVLIVEDIVTTGGSIFEIIELVKTMNVNIIGVSSLVHRCKDDIDFGCDYKSLLKLKIDTWEPNNLPSHLIDVPITKPGSTGK